MSFNVSLTNDILKHTCIVEINRALSVLGKLQYMLSFLCGSQATILKFHLLIFSELQIRWEVMIILA